VHCNDKPRIEQLTRLDDSRWAYCAECLLLKLRGNFTQDALQTSASERHCTKYDGVINLRPCSPLALRDRTNLINFLQSHDTNPDALYGCFEFLSDELPSNDRCPFYSKNDREVRICSERYVRPLALLMVDVWYSVRLSSVDSVRTASPVFACPHVDLIPLIHKTEDFIKCNKCLAFIWRDPKSVDDPDLVTFSANRVLGSGAKWADSYWHSRCHDYENRAGKSQRN
jgi:hypothetical protein